MNRLDNIIWHALNGPQGKFAIGTDAARRYALGFSPIVGFANAECPDFAALASFCEPGEQLYCGGWSDEPPDGWRIEVDSLMVQMVWEAPIPAVDEAPDAVPLGPEHVSRAVELATLMRPGPFGLRTIELGDYYGSFDGQRLAAMAGERMFDGHFHEVSGVATHPDFQGRGLARGLMLKLIRRQMLRGETPFLHVMRENYRAREIYERMGFRDRRELVIRVISRY